MFKVPELNRIRSGEFASDRNDGNNGAFRIPLNSNGDEAFVIASDGMGWEHVSVHVVNFKKKAKAEKYLFIPSWNYMEKIKNIFWGPEDCVMQLHPPKSRYINNDPNVLHLWRPIKRSIPQPPTILVGISDDNNTSEPNNILTDLVSSMKEDSDFQRSYIDNIAMAFKDCYSSFRKDTKKRTLSFEDIHVIANDAASNFIKQLIDIESN